MLRRKTAEMALLPLYAGADALALSRNVLIVALRDAATGTVYVSFKADDPVNGGSGGGSSLRRQLEQLGGAPRSLSATTGIVVDFQLVLAGPLLSLAAAPTPNGSSVVPSSSAAALEDVVSAVVSSLMSTLSASTTVASFMSPVLAKISTDTNVAAAALGVTSSASSVVASSPSPSPSPSMQPCITYIAYTAPSPTPLSATLGDELVVSWIPPAAGDTDLTLTFDFSTPAGWFAFGFRDGAAGGMVGSDVWLMRWLAASQSLELTDAYANGQYLPDTDAQQDVTLVDAHIDDNGRLSVTVKRALQTGDTADRDIDVTADAISYVVAAWDTTTNDFGYHGPNKVTSTLVFAPSPPAGSPSPAAVGVYCSASPSAAGAVASPSPAPAAAAASAGAAPASPTATPSSSLTSSVSRTPSKSVTGSRTATRSASVSPSVPASPPAAATVTAVIGAGTVSTVTVNNLISFSWVIPEAHEPSINITFTYKAPAGWFAFGLRSDLGMAGCDIWFMRMRNGAGEVIDSYATAQAFPPQDSSQDVSLVSSRVLPDGSALEFVVRRLLKPSDSNDVAFGAPGVSTPIALAWSASSNTYAYHGTNRYTGSLVFQPTATSGSGLQEDLDAEETVRLKSYGFHAFSMSVVWGLIVPAAILAQRFFPHVPATLAFHKWAATFAISLTLPAAGQALLASSGSGRSGAHLGIGFAVTAAMLVQVAMGSLTSMYLRGTKRPPKWFKWLRYGHKVLGYGEAVLALVNCTLGLILLVGATKAAYYSAYFGVLSIVIALLWALEAREKYNKSLLLGKRREKLAADIADNLANGESSRFAALARVIAGGGTADSINELRARLARSVQSMTLADVKRALQAGRKWVIYQGLVIDVSTFQASHPGGAYVLESNLGEDISSWFAGRGDETDASTAHVHSERARRILLKLAVGTIRVDAASLDWADTEASGDLDNEPSLHWTLVQRTRVTKNRAMPVYRLVFRKDGTTNAIGSRPIAWKPSSFGRYVLARVPWKKVDALLEADSSTDTGTSGVSSGGEGLDNDDDEEEDGTVAVVGEGGGGDSEGASPSRPAAGPSALVPPTPRSALRKPLPGEASSDPTPDAGGSFMSVGAAGSPVSFHRQRPGVPVLPLGSASKSVLGAAGTQTLGRGPDSASSWRLPPSNVGAAPASPAQLTEAPPVPPHADSLSALVSSVDAAVAAPSSAVAASRSILKSRPTAADEGGRAHGGSKVAAVSQHSRGRGSRAEAPDDAPDSAVVASTDDAAIEAAAQQLKRKISYARIPSTKIIVDEPSVATADSAQSGGSARLAIDMPPGRPMVDAPVTPVRRGGGHDSPASTDGADHLPTRIPVNMTASTRSGKRSRRQAEASCWARLLQVLCCRTRNSRSRVAPHHGYGNSSASISSRSPRVGTPVTSPRLKSGAGANEQTALSRRIKDVDGTSTRRLQQRGLQITRYASTAATGSGAGVGFASGRRASITGDSSRSVGSARTAASEVSASEEEDEEEEELVERPYSIARADGVAGALVLYIRRYPTGSVSRYMTDLRVGDKLLTSGPRGMGLRLDNRAGGTIVAVVQGTGFVSIVDCIAHVTACYFARLSREYTQAQRSAAQNSIESGGALGAAWDTAEHRSAIDVTGTGASSIGAEGVGGPHLKLIVIACYEKEDDVIDYERLCWIHKHCPDVSIFFNFSRPTGKFGPLPGSAAASARSPGRGTPAASARSPAATTRLALDQPDGAFTSQRASARQPPPFVAHLRRDSMETGGTSTRRASVASTGGDGDPTASTRAAKALGVDLSPEALMGGGPLPPIMPFRGPPAITVGRLTHPRLVSFLPDEDLLGVVCCGKPLFVATVRDAYALLGLPRTMFTAIA